MAFLKSNQGFAIVELQDDVLGEGFITNVNFQLQLQAVIGQFSTVFGILSVYKW